MNEFRPTNLSNAVVKLKQILSVNQSVNRDNFVECLLQDMDGGN